MVYAQRRLMDGRRTLRQIVDELDLCGSPSGVPFLARPRRQEIFACFDRCRFLDLL